MSYCIQMQVNQFNDDLNYRNESIMSMTLLTASLFPFPVIASITQEYYIKFSIQTRTAMFVHS